MIRKVITTTACLLLAAILPYNSSMLSASASGAVGNRSQIEQKLSMIPVINSLLLYDRAVDPVQYQTVWESRGIGGGGGLFSPSISPHNPNELFMTTDMSSVFHSRDFGLSWDIVDFRVLQGGHRTNVRFTSDAKVLYAVHCSDELDYGTPVRSGDGGSTWSALSGDPTYNEVWFLDADPASSSRLIIASYDTVYFSDDSGQSFTQVYSADDLHIAGVFWDGSKIYIGTRLGLVVSDNSGQSFSLHAATGGPSTSEPMISMAGAKADGKTRLFAVTVESVWPGISAYDSIWSYTNIYRLDAGSSSWQSVGAGLPDPVHPVFVGMALNDSETAYVAGGNLDTYAPAVYKSSNGGESWTDVFMTENNANIITGWSGDGGDEGWWFGELALGFAVSPGDSSRVMITDLGFVHVTDNGGTLWRQAYVDSRDENPAGSQISRGGTYRGVGLQQTSCWWLHWSDSDTLTAAFTDISGMRSTDGGLSWTAGSYLGLDYNSTYHFEEQGGALYAAVSSVHDLYQSTYLTDSRIDSGEGAVLISRDKGASWELIHDFGHPVIWLAADPNDAATLYASVVHSTQGGIYVTRDLSRDSSATWTRLSAPSRTQGHPFVIEVLNDGGLVVSYSGRRDGSGAFTESSGIFYSDDDGATWQDRSHSNMYRWTKDVVVDPHDSTQNTWYAGVFSHWGTSNNEVGGVYKTKDRGVNWDRISDLYRVESVALDPENPDLMYVATEQQGLWKSENKKSATPSFSQIERYPFKHPTRVFFNPYNLKEVWSTSFGGGLRALLIDQ